MKRTTTTFVLLAAMTVILAAANIMCGAVSIPPSAVADILAGRGCDNRAWEYIIVESRLPQTITAFMSGAALSVSGLMLQTAFANPLAGPSILETDFNISQVAEAVGYHHPGRFSSLFQAHTGLYPEEYRKLLR